MKVTKNLNIKMNRQDRVCNDKPNPRWSHWRWNRKPTGCEGQLGCDAINPRWSKVDKKVDKKVTPIVKEQAKTLSF